MDLEDVMDREIETDAAVRRGEQPQPEPEAVDEFRNDLQKLINHHSKENGSNTPDLFLADYLVACLAAFDAATKARDVWYGEGHQLDGNRA